MPTSVCGLSTLLPPIVYCAGAVGRQAGDHFEDGGLAAAARPDDGDEFGAPDVEIDVGAGVDVAVFRLVALADVSEPDVCGSFIFLQQVRGQERPGRAVRTSCEAGGQKVLLYFLAA